MNALRKIHDGLIEGGLLIDTQPVSEHPPVEAGGEELGTLDMRAWGETIAAVDSLVEEAVADGLFAVDAERRFTVSDTFDDGREMVATVSGWQGTRFPGALARAVAGTSPPIGVHQEVRLRVLRALR